MSKIVKLKQDDYKKWNYRVIRRKTTDMSEPGLDIPSEDYYTIEEVFYDEEGKPTMHTTDIGVGATSLDELKELIERLHNALKDDVVDEIVVEDE
tara:strand:- start:717 stop:1001 length:285 start_codon:yes stop_codon:yes gene_type:complete